MKSNCLQPLVCTRYWLLFFFSTLAIVARSQAPTCPDEILPGKMSVSQKYACGGSTLTFGLTGYTSAPVMLYFLQSSATVDGVYQTSAANTSDPADLYTEALPGVTYYRIAEYCTVGGIWVYSDTVAVTGLSGGPMGGHYTINATQGFTTTNFPSFEAATAALMCRGIDDAVVFDVTTTNTTYNEQIIIPEIQGTSATNTITFNGNGNTIAFRVTNSMVPGLITLNGADYVTIDSLRINATLGEYGFGVHLTNDADNNTIRRCTVNAGIGATSSFYAGMVISASEHAANSGDSRCDNNLFVNNTITGGYYGMVMTGNNNSAITGNKFIGNDIKDVNSYGIRMDYADQSLIAGNSISRPTRTTFSGSFWGISLEASCKGAQITGNRIFNTFGGDITSTMQSYGIYLSACDATEASPNLIYNNLLYHFNGGGNTTGFYSGSSDYAYFYHNTISLDNTAGAAAYFARGIYQEATAAGIVFKNNIVSVTRGGGGANHCIYIASAGNAYTSDNNNLYIPGGTANNIGYSGSSRTTLANWQGGTGKDAASISVDPLFLSIREHNLKPNNPLMDNKGVPVGIASDVDGVTRNASTPDIGAYEFAQQACTTPPQAGVVMISETPVCASGSSVLSLNDGDLGAGITYQWQSSPDSATWVNMAAATGVQATITQTAETWYRVVSTCGAGSTPSAGVIVRMIPAIKGEYTINSKQATAGTNFTSFNDAWNAIKCGITGPVVFDVVAGSGPYNEQLIVTPVSGASKENTITFNGNGNTITHTAVNNNERATIKLNGADHFIFNNLVIENTGAGASGFGYGVHLMNDADSNVIKGCIIRVDAANSTGSFNYAGIAVSGFASSATIGTAGCDYNVFEDNTVTGGYYGMTLGSTNDKPNAGNIIRRNRFSDFYNYGLYVTASNGTLIDSNVISRPSRSAVTEFNGIYLTGTHNKDVITRNTITNPFGGSPGDVSWFYGISLNAASAAKGTENLVSNNLVYNINGGGNVYALYNDGSENVLYVHNTIHLDGAVNSDSYKTVGFYQDTKAAGIDIRNNIFTISRSGAGLKYALYFATGTSTLTADYNNFYNFSTEGNYYTGFWSYNRATLANWQAAGFDAHSLNSDPAYTDIAAGNLAPASGAVDNLAQPLSALVAGDITGKARSATTPDMGAYEFVAPACTTPPVAGAISGIDTVVCENTVLGFNVTGNSAGSAQTYQWLAAETLAGTYSPVSGVLTNPLFNLAMTNTRYVKMATTCGGISGYTEPVKITVNHALAGGTYSIDTNGTGHFLNFNEAKAAMTCGIKGPVVFDAVPTTKVYNEQLLLDSVIGASAVNTITFNGNGNTIHYGTQNTDARAAIALNGTKYVTFNDLKITLDKDSAYGWGIFLTNNADNNTFNRCSVSIPLTLTSANYAGVVISASATDATSTGFSGCDNNQFKNDTTSGGYYGMVLGGGAANLVTGNSFTGNTVKDFYNYGIYLGATANTVVEGNDISRPSRAMVGTFNGIYYSGAGSNMLISKNRIHNPAGGTALAHTAYAMQITGSNAPDNAPTVIASNLVYDFNNTGDRYGYYLSFSKNTHYYHNTTSLESAAGNDAYSTYGVYNLGAVAAGVEFKNNQLSIGRAGSGANYGFYYAAGFSGVSDYNNVYITTTGATTGWGYSGGRQATLASWQAKTSADAHSFELNPVYENAPAFNFKPTRGLLDNKGIPAGITTDITNAARSASVPDIGAYEFSTTVCTSPPTPGIAAVSPASGVCIGATVQLSLSGNSIGTAQKYVWQRAATQAGPWTAISDSIDISDFTYELENAETWFRAMVICGNGVDSATPARVTLNAHLLAGDYTIDPSRPANGINFTSFNDALAAMACGIEGSVRFHAAAGTYTERLTIPKIPGTSAAATVTFLSADNNAASVVLTSECTEDSNYVVKLDNSNYIIFKNISITATGTDYGRVVELAGTSSNDTITACIIKAPVASAVDTDHRLSGVYGVGITGVNNTVTKNTITNGHSGIYVWGVAHATKRFTADENIVSGAYAVEISVKYIDSSSVSGNTITKTGALNETSHGIYMEYVDSLYRIERNSVTVSNTTSNIYGIQIGGCRGTSARNSSISFNKVKATEGMSGHLYGLMESECEYNNTRNNAIDVSTQGEGLATYGLAATGNMKAVNMFHNSIRNSSNSAGARAVMFTPATVLSVQDNKLDIRNNIFASTGGGAVLFLVNAASCYMDYNLFYSAGTLLGQMEGTFATTLQQWQGAAMGDYHSLVYKPAFAASGVLEPDVNSAEVWAMHGRGVQMPGDATDINGNKRPVTLQEGVPDLGAYEFVPASVPVSLTATPAAPAANTTQVFMLGTDTVTKITWGNVVPASIEGKRYSGKAPENLAAGKDYMYFYTAFTTTGTTPAGHTVKQFYLEPWRGYINDEATIQLGKTNASDVWEVAALSRVNTETNVITDTGMTVLYKFTGLTDGRVATEPPPAIPDTKDSSNSGTQFWVGYGHHQYFETGNTQEMALYLSAGSKEAHVTVHVNGTPWTKNYTVPANTVITSDLLPKFGPADSRLLGEGLSDRGISISSDVPVNAYAHIYGATASAATMLMPVGTYGYEYYTLSGKQSFDKNTYSWFYVIAAYDSTLVEITPSQATVGGQAAGTAFRMLLKKGEVYQVMGAPKDNATDYDLSGSKVRSVSNEHGKCYPVAVFSGSSRTSVLCTSNSVLNAGTDNLIQQNFSYRSWGKKYLTTPTSTDATPNKQNMNIFKIMVREAGTVVKKNGQQLTDLVDGKYYRIESAESDYIEADKPVMVAQFMPSATTGVCGYVGLGDPEMIYLSPLEQGIKEATLYRTTQTAIVAQYVTLVIPDAGIPSLTIDGSTIADYSYAHPHLTGYTVVVKRWTAANAQVKIKSDYPFTAITYGMGAGESYGYNAGMRVVNQSAASAISNVHNPAPGTYNEYTCAGTPLNLHFFTTLNPTRVEWKLSEVQGLQPHTDTTMENPAAADMVTINGVTYNKYTLSSGIVFEKPGTYTVPVYISHPDIDACDSRLPVMITVVVAESPVADFTNSANCAGMDIQFNGSATPVNSAAVYSWAWKFADNGATAATQNTTHQFKDAGTYEVQLAITDNNGCIADTVKQLAIQPQLAAPVVKVGVVTATTVNFTWEAVTGATGYEVSLDNGATWITPSSGATGTSHSITGLQVGVTVTIQVRALGGCVPAVSTAVAATTAIDEVYIPNSFTPDGNGPVENETFRVYGNSVKQVHMLIFNQWGEKIFETVSATQGWNGTHKGKPQPSGVYIYVVDITLVNNKHITKKGSINLVR